MSLLAYTAIFGLMNQNSEDPGAERRAAFKSIQALDHRHPGILDDFFCHIPIGHMSHRHADEGAVVLVHEFIEGAFVALAKPDDKLLLVLGQRLAFLARRGVYKPRSVSQRLRTGGGNGVHDRPPMCSSSVT